MRSFYLCITHMLIKTKNVAMSSCPGVREINWKCEHCPYYIENQVEETDDDFSRENDNISQLLEGE